MRTIACIVLLVGLTVAPVASARTVLSVDNIAIEVENSVSAKMGPLTCSSGLLGLNFSATSVTQGVVTQAAASQVAEPEKCLVLVYIIYPDGTVVKKWEIIDCPPK